MSPKACTGFKWREFLTLKLLEPIATLPPYELHDGRVFCTFLAAERVIGGTSSNHIPMVFTLDVGDALSKWKRLPLAPPSSEVAPCIPFILSVVYSERSLYILEGHTRLTKKSPLKSLF